MQLAQRTPRKLEDIWGAGHYISGYDDSPEDPIVAAALVACVKKYRKSDFEEVAAGLEDGFFDHNKQLSGKHDGCHDYGFEE